MSTRGGMCGFVVRLADGRVFAEAEHTWDEVPDDVPVVSLALAHQKLPVEWLKLEHFQRFFFSNVGVTRRSAGVVDGGQHIGKVLGGCNGERAVRIEVDFPPDSNAPRVISKLALSVDALDFLPHAFRPGVR